MAGPLSLDLRERLVAAVEAGMSRRSAAERFGVSPSSAIRWIAAWRKTGSVAAKSQGGDRRSHRIEALRASIFAAIEAQPDITLGEMAALLQAEHGARFAPSSVWRLLARHGITVKENCARRRADPARRRRTARSLGRGAA
jgi:transposase